MRLLRPHNQNRVLNAHFAKECLCEPYLQFPECLERAKQGGHVRAVHFVQAEHVEVNPKSLNINGPADKKGRHQTLPLLLS